MASRQLGPAGISGTDAISLRLDVDAPHWLGYYLGILRRDMTEPRISRPITVTQVVGMLALVLIVFFIASFASKAVETYRLRAWLYDMEQEIASMERQYAALELEKQRRESEAWIDEALKEAGLMPPDVLVVRVVAPDVAPTPPPREIVPGLAPRLPGAGEIGPLFDNPNWKAWVDLILNRD
jgi:hypothetical protein